MDSDELKELPRLTWMQSRIPKRKALVTFVNDGPGCPPMIEAAIKGYPSRWYPEPGGHRVLVLYEGGEYDKSIFRLELEGWEHEECDACGEIIIPLTLCYVTVSGNYVALCEHCHQKYVLEKLA